MNIKNNINSKTISKKILLWQKIILVFLGLFLAALILEIGLRTAGFTMLSMQKHKNLQSIKQNGEFRIMCIGESTTQSQYPPYLEETLNKRNIGVKISVLDEGLSGTNIGVILLRLESNLDKYQPAIVVTMLGINDGEGSHLPYEVNSNSKIISAFKSLKVCKLMRLIWLHMEAKLKESGFFMAMGHNRTVERFNESHKGEDSSLKQKHVPGEAIELSPKNDSAYTGLGYFYKTQGKHTESEQAFKKAIELSPKNDSAYLALGQLYRDQGKHTESEQAFKKAIELSPKNDSAYIGLGQLYRDQGKLSDLEQILKKIIEINPKNDYAYAELGRLYKELGRYAESEQILKKAIEFDRRNDSAYAGLGWLYKDQGRLLEQEEAFKKAVELNPENYSAYIGLGSFYRSQGKIIESEQVFEKAIELNPRNDFAIGGLATIYCEMGRNELSKTYVDKLNNLRGGFYNPVTINNYHKLKQILDKRKIKLVCAQYPMRSVQPLKKIFKDDENIIFVDNERIFKDAVRKEGYNEYFRDMFGGDFGHCTHKGNRLLAQNIANAILKEIFGK